MICLMSLTFWCYNRFIMRPKHETGNLVCLCFKLWCMQESLKLVLKFRIRIWTNLYPKYWTSVCLCWGYKWCLKSCSLLKRGVLLFFVIELTIFTLLFFQFPHTLRFRSPVTDLCVLLLLDNYILQPPTIHFFIQTLCRFRFRYLY